NPICHRHRSTRNLSHPVAFRRVLVVMSMQNRPLVAVLRGTRTQDGANHGGSRSSCRTAMSLFDNLRRRYRKEKFQLEDFHTEIVAQVLHNSRPLTLAWLRGIKATALRNPDKVKIVTQENFAALADHATDSRPDIAIRLVEGNRTELILIESKVGAKEGPDQLKLYAEQLAAKQKQGLQRTAL